MEYLIQKLREIKLDVKRKRNNDVNKKDKAKEMEKYVGCTIPTTVTIQPPKRSKNKVSGKRIESEVQKALEQHTKKPRYCKICGGRGHDSRNCKGNTEEKGSFHKPRYCKNCGGQGHDSQNCNENVDDTYEDNDQSYNDSDDDGKS
ncbi:hypothetical protein RND81_14G196100 [Saponaria officinalis]|uniref:CCHC-type domain-containing protein n=1 Tax=Saponaria officinalis TaxID=3572 RepID=A0AAW1GNX8_SAPOF